MRIWILSFIGCGVGAAGEVEWVGTNAWVPSPSMRTNAPRRKGPSTIAVREGLVNGTAAASVVGFGCSLRCLLRPAQYGGSLRTAPGAGSDHVGRALARDGGLVWRRTRGYPRSAPDQAAPLELALRNCPVPAGRHGEPRAP